MRFPKIGLHLVEDELGHPFYLLAGFEPDFEWHGFLRSVIDLIDALEINRTVWMHSIPMPVPHTRPLSSSVSGTRQDLIDELSIWRPQSEIPASVLHALEYRLSQSGHEVTGFTMLTPHYLADTEYPAVAVAALERISMTTGLVLPTDDLRDRAEEFTVHVAEQIGQNAELATMVKNLEGRFDQYMAQVEPGRLADPAKIPSADEIGAEFENFLARHANGEDGEGGGHTGKGPSAS